jgi:hypothetical protein
MKQLITLAVLLVSLAPRLQAATYSVNPEGSGDFATIQQAINASSDGDSVELSDGVFTGPGNCDLDFGGKQIVVLSQSGNATRCIIDCQGSPSSLHSGFRFHSGEDTLSVVRDINITGGYDVFGGAINCIESSPKIVGCRISENEASAKGGGIYFEGSGSSGAVVSGCRIVWNQSEADGGGIYFSECGPKIIRSRISANTALVNGGGLYSLSGCETIYDCTISGNYSFEGGGIYLFGSTPIVENSTIVGNRASFRGGGAVCRSSAVGTFLRSVLWGNCAFNGPQAYLRDSEIILSCAAFERGGINGSGQVGEINGTVNEDPIFCLPYGCASAPTEEGDYAVSANSPCLPFDSPCGEQIGILKTGCGPDSRVELNSWGMIKAMFKP